MTFPYVTEPGGPDGALGPGGGFKGIRASAPAVILFIAALVFSSCAAKPPPGPKYLHPAPALGATYSATDERAVIDNESLTITVTPLAPGSPGTKSIAPLFAEMLQQNFVIINTAIKNNSSEKLIYNPAFTRLVNDVPERRKPLDYTDLYDVLAGQDKDASPEPRLREVRGEFYDRNLTLGPGVETSRLLVFLPISEEAETAVLMMDNIYIGTDTVDVSFPFVINGGGGGGGTGE